MTYIPLLLISAGMLTLTLSSAYAATPTPLDTCVKAVLSKHPGKVVSLSSEVEDGRAQYELDVKGADGSAWEAECDARTGRLLRIEREIKSNSADFKSKAKLSEDEAKKLALNKYPGDVLNTEYDIEDDGEISYEFIIHTKSGKIVEVEVDAISGKLAGDETVNYRIGE